MLLATSGLGAYRYLFPNHAARAFVAHLSLTRNTKLDLSISVERSLSIQPQISRIDSIPASVNNVQISVAKCGPGQYFPDSLSQPTVVIVG